MSDTELLCGDCFELMRGIPSESVDMILTDPPYGITRCKWDKVQPFEPMWEQYKRIIKPNGCIAIFAGEPFSSALVQSNLKMYRYELIWQKNAASDFLNANHKPLKIHDKIQIFYRTSPTYHPQKTKGEPYQRIERRARRKIRDLYRAIDAIGRVNETGDRYPTTVIRFPIERGLHPTQKPVSLLAWLIRTYTDAGDTVLDSFMGSGSTGVACVQEGRRFIGIEREDKYFEVAKRRSEEARGSLFG